MSLLWLNHSHSFYFFGLYILSSNINYFQNTKLIKTTMTVVKSFENLLIDCYVFFSWLFVMFLFKSQRSLKWVKPLFKNLYSLFLADEFVLENELEMQIITEWHHSFSLFGSPGEILWELAAEPIDIMQEIYVHKVMLFMCEKCTCLVLWAHGYAC